MKLALSVVMVFLNVLSQFCIWASTFLAAVRASSSVRHVKVDESDRLMSASLMYCW